MEADSEKPFMSKILQPRYRNVHKKMQLWVTLHNHL